MLILLMVLLAGLWLWPVGPEARPLRPPEPLPPGLRLPYFRLPEGLTLCGEAVPFQEPEVREALDREFTIVVWNRAQTLMWLKRANRHFPDIARKIRAQGLPLDLKYVVLVESDLRPKARSPAGALGPWQFMPPTAQRFQLRVGEQVDDRLDLDAATTAALRYLATLHRTFGTWSLALAAYNCGEGRVQRAINDQGVRDYYYLSLPEETERYVPRILAAKAVLEAPEAYGYDIPYDDLYQPLAVDEANIILTQDTSVRRLAEAAGTYIKHLKSLNPWIKTLTLPPGNYHFLLPKGSAARFLEAVRQGRV
ncbi:MAG: lytic transglycosylase domain-containing protein [Deltaproteobacteria bacterium]|nr:lytic transglycosylase domain-containing protein [Deltaproteobacteria bacterium]